MEELEDDLVMTKENYAEDVPLSHLDNSMGNLHNLAEPMKLFDFVFFEVVMLQSSLLFTFVFQFPVIGHETTANADAEVTKSFVMVSRIRSVFCVKRVQCKLYCFI